MESLYVPVSDFKETYLNILNRKNVEVKISRLNLTDFDNIFIYLFLNNNSHETVSNLEKAERSLTISSKLIYKWIGNVKLFQKIRFFIESLFESPLDWNATHTDRNLLMYESAKPMFEFEFKILDHIYTIL
jgi:hypothetical protein